jgi:hypothetical protein
MRIIPMLCTIALAAPLAVGAQEAVNSSWPLASGSRVRILSPVLGEKKEQGTVVSMTSESILFRQKSAQASQSLGVNAITQMDVSRGTHSRKLKGAGLGFVIAGLASAAITAATWQKPKDCFMCMDFGRAGDSAFIGAFGGAVGAVVGLLVGARQTETWEPVYIPKP